MGGFRVFFSCFDGNGKSATKWNGESDRSPQRGMNKRCGLKTATGKNRS